MSNKIVFNASMAVAVAIFIGAWLYSGTIESHYSSAEDADPQAIRDRIRPIGTAIVEGQELPARPVAAAAAASVSATVADSAASTATKTVTSTVANAGQQSVDPVAALVTDAAAVTAAATSAGASKVGEDTYKMACIACHMTGVAGSPKTGDVAAWAPRIAQGMDVLNEHAIKGYQGSAGIMPAKGGRVDLSDEVIIAAVAYMVRESGGP